MRFIGFKKVDKLVAISVLGSVLLTWASGRAGFVQGFYTEINDVGTGQYT